MFDCLNSINNQNYTLELIFVNDGSTDKSISIFDNFIFNDFIKVKRISRQNKGFLFSLQQAISVSSGKLIARIDADDYWCDNHLNEVVKKFEQNPKFVLIGSQCNYIENSVLKKTSNFPSTHNSIIKYLHKDSPFIHSSVVFKKDAYFKTPGYLIGESQTLSHIADYNLWFELSKIGQFYNLQFVTVNYRVFSDSMSRSIDLKKNYLIRLKLMSKVNIYYSKHIIYSFFQRLKVLLRILQHSI